MEAMQEAKAAAAAAREAELTKTMEQTEIDITYAGITTTNASVPSSKPGAKKKPGKPKLTAKEKKERSVRLSPAFPSKKSVTCLSQIEIEKVISCLPLEFRGSDPVRLTFNPSQLIFMRVIQNLRRNMEGVIEGLLNAPNQTAKCTTPVKLVLPSLIFPSNGPYLAA